MSIYSRCGACKGEMIDYLCPGCLLAERDRLADTLAAVRPFVVLRKCYGVGGETRCVGCGGREECARECAAARAANLLGEVGSTHAKP